MLPGESAPAPHPARPRAGRPRRRAGAWAAAALALAGCSTAHLSTPDVRTPAAYEAGGAADASLPAQALDRWWTLFGDAQLTALVEDALQRAPDARTALQRVEESRSARDQALSRFGLQGDLSGLAQVQHTAESVSGLNGLGVGTTGVTGGTDSTGATGSTGTTGAVGSSSAFLSPGGTLYTGGGQFSVTYELDLFGRRQATRRGALADLAAARFDYEATRATLARDVATGLFQARGYAIQVDDARETARIAGDLARSARLSAARGLTSTGSAARLETDFGTAQAETTRLEALAGSSRRTLLALVGRGTEPLASLPVQPVAEPPPSPPAVTPGDLLRRRPDVREAEARLRSRAQTLKLDRLALFPTLTLAPGGQVSSVSGTYDATTTIWTAGVNAMLPVLDRPRLLAVIRGDRARGEEAVVAYEQAVQAAYRDAENGLTALASDRARVAVLTVAVDRARFAFDASRRGYELGLLDLNTLLDSERSWRAARATLTTAQIVALTDAATLFQALGGGWTPPA